MFYYYQTFVGLDELIDNPIIRSINVEAIHFGFNDDNSPYIHLNDHPPNDKIFDLLWNQLYLLKEQKIKIILMVGGGGGAYEMLFNHFDTFYPMFFYLISNKLDLFDGIDIDIEETVTISSIVKLFNKIHTDFGSNFTISMAPMNTELMYDKPGMAGINYKELYNLVGENISYFHVQAYDDFSLDCFKSIINNGYPESKLFLAWSLDNTIVILLKMH